LLFLGRFVPMIIRSLLLQSCNEVLYMPMEAISHRRLTLHARQRYDSFMTSVYQGGKDQERKRFINLT